MKSNSPKIFISIISFDNEFLQILIFGILKLRNNLNLYNRYHIIFLYIIFVFKIQDLSSAHPDLIYIFFQNKIRILQ